MTQAQSDFAMTLNQLQEQVRELKAAQGWTEESLERRVVFLVSEVGEMAKEILKLGDVSPDTDRESIKENLGMELYDIIWNLCDLANLLMLRTWAPSGFPCHPWRQAGRMPREPTGCPGEAA